MEQEPTVGVSDAARGAGCRALQRSRDAVPLAVMEHDAVPCVTLSYNKQLQVPFH
jgi:hypothetical protein